MEFKIIILIVLAILLVFALIRKLLFLALAVVIIGFAFYTGLANEAILFLKELLAIVINNPPPILVGILKGLI